MSNNESDMKQQVEFCKDKIFEQMKAISKLETAVKKMAESLSQCEERFRSAMPVKKENTYGYSVGDKVQFALDGEQVIGEITSINNGLARVYRRGVNGASVSLIFNVPLCELMPVTESQTLFDYAAVSMSDMEANGDIRVGDTVSYKRNKKTYEGVVCEIMTDPSSYVVSSQGRKFVLRKYEVKFVSRPRWVFTDDEKAVLRNLPEDYKWIARDGYGLYVFADKPYKMEGDYNCDDKWANLELFGHLFQSIKREDDEPCEFRKFI